MHGRDGRAGARRPSRADHATATPRHRAVALQPSTQAIGEVGLPLRTAHRRSSSDSDRAASSPLPSTVSRYEGSVAASVTPAFAAVLLTGTPCGPTRGSRGASTDDRGQRAEGLADRRDDERSRRGARPPRGTLAATGLPMLAPSTTASTAASGDRDDRASRAAPIFAPMCTMSAPTVIHAAA